MLAGDGVAAPHDVERPVEVGGVLCGELADAGPLDRAEIGVHDDDPIRRVADRGGVLEEGDEECGGVLAAARVREHPVVVVQVGCAGERGSGLEVRHDIDDTWPERNRQRHARA